MNNATGKQPWKRKAIWFIVSQAVTIFGSNIVQMAVIWHITLTTSSGFWVTVLTLSSLLPQVIISFFAGVWADRFDRKKIIILADLGITITTLVLALFLKVTNFENLQLAAIIILSSLRAIGSGIQAPAVGAMIPQIVPKENLSRFNGINGSVQSLIQFSSPAAAGLLLSGGSLFQVLFVDVITGIIGMAILLLLQIPPATIQEQSPPESLFQDLKAGLKYVYAYPQLKRLFLIYGLFILLSVPSGFLTPLMVERLFGGKYAFLSLTEILGFGGMLLGGLVIGAWGGFKSRIKTFALGLAIYGVFAIGLGLSQSFWLFAVALFLMSIGIPFAQTSIITLVQEKTAPEKLGRVYSLLGVMFNGFLPIGMVIFGPLADAIPLGWLMVATGLPLAVLAISIPSQKVFAKWDSNPA